MTKLKDTVKLAVDERELATILAALRFHQDENLQSCDDIPDTAIKEIATNGGSLKPLNFDEVARLCERINTSEEACNASLSMGLTIAPPPKEKGEEPLFRVVYVIDVNAADANAAAVESYRIMTGPDSLSPVLQIIDYKGYATTIDLSEDNFEGRSYSRKWKCPDCGKVVDCSYENLAEVGTSYCSDCDIEMQMI